MLKLETNLNVVDFVFKKKNNKNQNGCIYYIYIMRIFATVYLTFTYLVVHYGNSIVPNDNLVRLKDSFRHFLAI